MSVVILGFTNGIGVVVGEVVPDVVPVVEKVVLWVVVVSPDLQDHSIRQGPRSHHISRHEKQRQ